MHKYRGGIRERCNCELRNACENEYLHNLKKQLSGRREKAMCPFQ